MSLGMWVQRGSFYFNNSNFLHFCFSWSAFFYWWKFVQKGKTRVPLQEPYLIWCSSCSTTLIYNIPGLEYSSLPVWYWKTSVKNKVLKIFPLFKQTNKQKEKKTHQRKFLGTDVEDSLLDCSSEGQFLSQCLSTRLYFSFMSWTSVRKSFHPTTNYLNLLSPSSTSLFISLDLQTDCVTWLPPLMPAQPSFRLSHFLMWHLVLFTANPQALL